MCIQAIPDHNDGTIDVPEELTEELDDPLGVDIPVRVKTEVQTGPLSSLHTQCSDRGHLLSVAGSMGQCRRFPARCPRLPNKGGHE